MNVDELFPFRVVSGFRPSRGLHLGHYGAVIRHLRQYQYVRTGAAFVFIADHHSLSAWDEQTTLSNAYQESVEIARQLLACGLDPSFCTLYIQSHVPELLEVMWFLSGLVSDGRLRQNPVFKQYSAPTVGVYLYPLLMVADIIATRATHVAIGRDQRQHMELARDLTRKLLQRFGQSLCPLPEYAVADPLLVRGINAPASQPAKMATEHRNDIPIFADEDVILNRIEHIVTRTVEWGAPLPADDCNIIQYAGFLMTEEALAELQEQYRSRTFGYREAKNVLKESFFAHFEDARKRYASLDDATVREVLRNGSITAREHVAAFAERLRQELRVTT